MIRTLGASANAGFCLKTPMPNAPKPMDYRVVQRDGADVLQQWRPQSGAPSKKKCRWVDVWEQPRGREACSPPATREPSRGDQLD